MRRYALLLAPLAAGVLLPSALVPGALTQAVRFLVFVVALVIPAGDLIARAALPDISPATRLRFAPLFGTAATVALSAFGARLHVGWASLALFPLALAGVLFRARDQRAPPPSPESDVPLWSDQLHALAAAVAIALVTIAYVLPSLPPTATRPGLFYQDTVWTIGNTEALLRWGLPLRDLRLEGVTFGYHIAQNLFEAAACRVVGIGAFEVHVFADPAWIFWCLAGVCAHAGRTFMGLGKVGSVFLVVSLLFVTEPGGVFHSNTYFCPLSYAFGVAPFVLLVAMVFGDLCGKQPLSPLAATLLFFLAAASKAHLLVLLPVALVVPVATRAYRERRLPVRREMLFAAGIVLSALFIRATLFSGESKGYGLALWPVVPGAFFHRLVFERLSLGPLAPIVFGVYHIVRPLVASVLTAFLFPPALLLLALGLSTSAGRTVLRTSLATRFVLTFTGVSLLVISVVCVVGGVRYFTLYPQLALTLLAAVVVEATWRAQRVKPVVIAVLTLGSMFLLRAVRTRQTTWGALPTASRATWDARVTVDLGEWEACQWLRANSPPEAVFFSDRRYFLHETERTPMPRFFAYSAIAGRQALVEGEEFLGPGSRPTAIARWREVDEVLTAAEHPGELVDRELRDVPASYFVQSLRFDHGDFSRAQSLELVYENSSAKVWRIRR
jgi:hypothetical protein